MMMLLFFGSNSQSMPRCLEIIICVHYLLLHPAFDRPNCTKLISFPFVYQNRIDKNMRLLEIHWRLLLRERLGEGKVKFEILQLNQSV